MQSFLKIIHFDDFRQFCTYRDGVICANEEGLKLCPRANKFTMENCPLWCKFQDFHIRRKNNVEERSEQRDRKQKNFNKREWEEDD